MVREKLVDETVLDDYINASGYKIGYIVDQMGISKTAFYKKKKGIIPFRASEIFTLCTLANIPLDVKAKIFTKNVDV